jgi:Ca2+-binding RTX toxin-like protein
VKVRIGTTAAAVLALLVLAPVARASSAHAAGSRVLVTGTGGADLVTAGYSSGRIVFTLGTDETPMHAGAGCAAQTGRVVCGSATTTALSVTLGGGADRFRRGSKETGPIAVTVSGGSGKDDLRGGDEPDRFLGGPGNDILISGGGGDRVAGNTGFDSIDAGSGADRIAADDGLADKIRCGTGTDVATVDQNDRTPNLSPKLADCETVHRIFVPVPTARPVVAFDGPQPVLDRGAILATLRCTAACLAHATVHVTVAGAKGFRIASKTLKIGVAGVRHGVRLRLSAKQKAKVAAALHDKRAVVAKLAAASVDRHGRVFHRAAKTRSLTLRR